MAGYPIDSLVDGLVDALVINSPFPTYAGEPMSAQMQEEMGKAMERLAIPIHDHIISWWESTEGGGGGDEMVKTDINDPESGFLDAKVDNITLKVNLGTHKIYVDSILSSFSIDNNVDDRVLTATGGCSINGEANLTFNAANLLTINGSIKLLNGAEVDTIETVLTDDDTHIPTSKAVYDKIIGGTHYKGEYNADTNTPDLDTSPSGIMMGDMYTVTVDGTFFTEAVQAGDFLIAEKTDPTLLTDWTVVNKNIPPYTFLNLNDSPASYTGEGGKFLKVNSVPDEIEFDMIAWSDITSGIPTTLLGYGISDTKENF